MGIPNHHNCVLSKTNWLTEQEKQALLSYAKSHPGEGSRRLTYMMMDDDVVAVSPSTTYRLLKACGLLDQWNTGKTNNRAPDFISLLTLTSTVIRT